VFKKAKPSLALGLTRDTLRLAAEMLNHPLSDEEVTDCLSFHRDTYAHSQHSHKNATNYVNGDGNGNGGGIGGMGDASHVPFEAFAEWWNSERLNPGLTELIASKMATSEVKGTGALFG
jgi:hypothetical protein